MVCRCSSPQMHAERAAEQASRTARYSEDRLRRELAEREAQLRSMTPDPSQHEVLRVERIGSHLVMQVKYPSCAACAFEGIKVLVYLNVPETQALLWRRIDPHFRAEAPASMQDAPSPAARFPATPDGWSDAVAYARSKVTR